MHFGSGNAKHVYVIGGSAVSSVEQLTDLGLTHTPDFSYATHLRNLVTKASRVSGMVYRVFSTRNESFLIKFFKKYGRPMLIICP